jgi:hypothetical protein
MLVPRKHQSSSCFSIELSFPLLSVSWEQDHTQGDGRKQRQGPLGRHMPGRLDLQALICFIMSEAAQGGLKNTDCVKHSKQNSEETGGFSRLVVSVDREERSWNSKHEVLHRRLLSLYGQTLKTNCKQTRQKQHERER